MFSLRPPPPLLPFLNKTETKIKTHYNKLKTNIWRFTQPVGACQQSVLDASPSYNYLFSALLVLLILHMNIYYTYICKKTMWCSLLFLSQDKKNELTENTDLPLISTVYKIYTFMHVSTVTWHCTTLFQYYLWSE